MLRLLKDIDIKFMAIRRIPIILSTILIVVSLSSIIIKGFNYGIDFSSGYIVQLKFQNEISVSKIESRFSSNKINDLQFDVGDINPADYQTKAEVFQLSRQGGSAISSSGGEDIVTLRQYDFEGIYPNAVSSIPLDYGATDQIEEFQVTFNYLFWTSELPGLPKGVESVSAGN